MYHSINEFLTDWKSESEATIKVFANLNDESLDYKNSQIGRTIGRLAWHITATIGEMLGSAGIKLEILNDDNSYPKKANEILGKYKQASDNLVKRLPNVWNDNSLTEKINMYGEEWTKEAVLTALIKHQIHHRAQMTALMRQAGLKVPGIYGPSYEEWKAMGMEPMV
jgi:uncharacterized damage-inducible protein DinB